MGEGPAMGKRFGLLSTSPRATINSATEAGPSAAARFLQEHEDTKNALRTAEDANEAFRVQLKDLMRENEELRQKLAAAERRVLFLQGYSTEITTCLEILRQSNQAIIGRAVAKARECGIAVAKGEFVAQEETAEAADEAREAAAIIARLPPNPI